MIEKGGFLMYMPLSDNKRDVIRSLLSYSSLGIEMGLSVAIGIGMGYYLDRFFKTAPYLTIIFMILGIVAAMKTIYTLLRKIQKDDERDNKH
jgi:ATP synthase protein I